MLIADSLFTITWAVPIFRITRLKRRTCADEAAIRNHFGAIAIAEVDKDPRGLHSIVIN